MFAVVRATRTTVHIIVIQLRTLCIYGMEVHAYCGGRRAQSSQAMFGIECFFFLIYYYQMPMGIVGGYFRAGVCAYTAENI